jgi:hypothetical protein
MVPEMSVKTLKVSNGFTQWPVTYLPFYNATIVDFSQNKIDAVGDLSSFMNVQNLNLSNNIINKLNPDLCKLNDLHTLDLSHNALDTIDMGYFFCNNNNSVSNLQWLYLNGNSIKSLNKLDLLFIALPLMVNFDISSNQLDLISIESLSQSSIDFLNNLKGEVGSIKQAIVDRINSINSFNYLFINNLIKHVSFNFELIYNSVTNVLPISDNLLLRFSSINLKSNSILCDCKLSKDINFILQGPFSDSPYYSNLTETSLFSTQCSNLKSKYSMASMANNKKLNLCQNKTNGSNATSTALGSSTTTLTSTLAVKDTTTTTKVSIINSTLATSNVNNPPNTTLTTISTTAATTSGQTTISTI